MEAHLPYAEFPIVNCGVDWLTCTSNEKSVEPALWKFGMRELLKAEATAGATTVASRLGFSGRTAGHIFLGQRPGDVMVQLSGTPCTPLAQEAITLSTNVSRIDLQVTVWTEGEQCNLAKWTRDKLVQQHVGSKRQPSLTLISSHPSGDTLGINRRCSDAYGRLYDKTAESDLGPQRLLWRYELELKGRQAKRVAKRLKECGARPTLVSSLVDAWYTEKGCRPSFASPDCDLTAQLACEAPRRDVLSWFRSSLSKTVAKAIRDHGRDVVLDALGLTKSL